MAQAFQTSELDLFEVSALHKRLMDVLRREYPDLDPTEIERAFWFAAEAHSNDHRRSGELFITHPVEVAVILANMQMGEETLIAALLHDVVEDTDIATEDIEREFGAQVAGLVESVTKLGRIPWTSEDSDADRAAREQTRQAESLRKMFLAMVDDVRVVLIKLADRLHNMRTLEHMPPAKQLRSARETMEIYAPLANRLGISQLKSELEDLAFKYLHPRAYQQIEMSLERQEHDRQEILDSFISDLLTKFREVKLDVTLEAREKHYYSIWRKMQRKEVDVSQIFDVLGVRVIVTTQPDCYAALGIIHANWRPVPGEFDDYIATPKESLYQSIHTAVLGPGGLPIEIQIRTREMHDIAENGLAAHWRYKENGKIDQNAERKIEWLRKLMDWRDEIADAQEWVESMKSDVFQELIYVFTPAGDVIELPAGATPVDFAYRIHTEVGHQCVGAKENDRHVPLDHKLSTGSVVRIFTSNSKVGPSRDWLMPANGYVVTASAREKIRQWFRRQARDENIAQGRDIIDRELKRINVDVKIDDLAKQFPSYQKVNDFLAAVGYGAISPQQLTARLVEDREPEFLPVPEEGRQRPTVAKGIQVMGVGDLYTRIANCCRPVYGDEITGYTTRGRGITVHRKDCPNIRHVDDEARLVEVSWGEQVEEYSVTIQGEAWDRVGLLRDITTMIADENVNMQSVLTDSHDDQTVTILLTISVTGIKQLSKVLQKMEAIRDVYEVRRVNPPPRNRSFNETASGKS